ncbi:histone-like nucleoid-structuring protein Lsr2 [Micropruina sonneratiae]|uniref:histone-like nucleoid-structuring protein Lsr2 n=1 Tax=Micropruina sonneratiae TaxID=2986940 RepID=UPI002226E835|nr:Lsr2 family protein [Micropruina sp. KQZ13P-5]MCW3156621.1 Lsr2 family protein [Micropruina sp. KQZ13P-5]
MAQRIVYRLEDDLDSTEAAETIVFGLDSVSYEIDLSEPNAAQFRDVLAPYVAAARRVGGRRRAGSTGTGRKRGTGSPATEIRAWATENGYQVSSRGRVPAEVREAYERAHA